MRLRAEQIRLSQSQLTPVEMDPKPTLYLVFHYKSHVFVSCPVFLQLFKKERLRKIPSGGL